MSADAMAERVLGYLRRIMRRSGPVAIPDGNCKHNELLEMIAQNERLERVLDRLAELLEGRCPGALCAVLLLRHSRLYHSSARRLPASLVEQLDGLSIGPAGAAPFWSHALAVRDIAHDEAWREHREAALAHGLGSCWSRPILSGAGEILGTLALYLPTHHKPTGEQEYALEEASRLAGIAIEQRHMVDELNFKANHDSLTRLANRALFEDRMRQAIPVAERGGFTVGLLRIDLDRFKTVNDLLGHRIGDELLVSVARRLRPSLRRSDTLARTGGDEFSILMMNIDSAEGAYVVAQRVLESLAEPFLVEGHELFVTASVGVSVYPADARHAEALERNADDALYRAKSEGRNMWQPFRQEMSKAACKKLELEAHLGGALARGEFSLHYQPQVNLRDGSVSGVEALLRWKHRELGMVSPASFIPVAEETGLIVPIGEWVLEEVCAQCRRWREADMPPVRVAVNVSALQFMRADFVDVVARLLRKYGIDPRLLELELTESGVMRDVELAARHMQALRRIGIRLAMDDFGTGYSSLSYLQKLPVDVLKLDQVFVRELGVPGDKPALVESMISLARLMGKHVIAEGVETQEHLDALCAVECDAAQGFLLGKPMPPEELVRWLEKRVAAGEALPLAG